MMLNLLQNKSIKLLEDMEPFFFFFFQDKHSIYNNIWKITILNEKLKIKIAINVRYYIFSVYKKARNGTTAALCARMVVNYEKL